MCQHQTLVSAPAITHVYLHVSSRNGAKILPERAVISRVCVVELFDSLDSSNNRAPSAAVSRETCYSFQTVWWAVHI